MIDPILRALEDTHLHVVGASGYGKSKFLQLLLESAMRQRYGVCLIDWHGTLYRDFLDVLGYERIGQSSGHILSRSPRPIYLLDLSENEYVTAYNPFAGGGEELSDLVSARIKAMSQAWGADNTDETPRLSRMLRCLFSFAAEAGTTLPNAALALYEEHKYLRTYAARIAQDPYIAEQWRELTTLTETRFQFLAESTLNRLDRLLAPLRVRRVIGREDGNIDIGRILDENAILLVNLNSRGASTEAGRTLAALLLTDFLSAAMSRAGKARRPFLLCLDEFQEYVTKDVVSMLDQVRKAGVRLALCHQRFGQLARYEELDDAIANEAQVKVVFGGLQFQSAEQLARDFFINDINREQIIDTVQRMVTKHNMEEMWTETLTMTSTKGKGQNLGEGSYEDSSMPPWMSAGNSEFEGKAESKTLSQHYMLMPYEEYEKSHDVYRDLGSKVSLAAEQLMDLKQRQCFVKLPQRKPRRYVVKTVPPLQRQPETQRAYETAIYKRMGALPAAEHDDLIERNTEAFLNRAKEALRKKKDREPKQNTVRPRT